MMNRELALPQRLKVRSSARAQARPSMSTEMHVLFRGKLPDRKVLSRELAELGFPFKIAASVGSLEKQNGFMPMWLRRDETGVEFDVFEGRDAIEELVGKELAPKFERTANFRWGGDENEA